MATNRKVIFATGEIYHVFNRGIERRPIFTSQREYQRFLNLISYYRYASVPMRFSEFAKLPSDAQSFVWQKLLDKSLFDVDIISYCFMPNHFHLLLRQRIDKGVSRFVSNTTNGYTKYFNTKHHRVGPLLQGTFKAVWVETEEQLLHLTRYIHLNPTTNYLVQEQNLQDYPWSSFQEYFGLKETGICDTSFLRSTFPSGKVYEEFVLDQVDYARELEKIKHLSIDED